MPIIAQLPPHFQWVNIIFKKSSYQALLRQSVKPKPHPTKNKFGNVSFLYFPKIVLFRKMIYNVAIRFDRA